MAKILSVDLLHVPEFIDVSDNETDITVITKIVFHELDLQLKMPYCIHLFVYDNIGSLDLPLIMANWDESNVIPITLDRSDDFLGKEVVHVMANEKELTIETPMALKLGKLMDGGSYDHKKLEVFVTAAPAIGRVTKWSEPFITKLLR